MLSFAALYSLHFIQIRIMVQEIRRKLPKTFSELWGQSAYLFNVKIFLNSLALLFARDRCHISSSAQNDEGACVLGVHRPSGTNIIKHFFLN